MNARCWKAAAALRTMASGAWVRLPMRMLSRVEVGRMRKGAAARRPSSRSATSPFTTSTGSGSLGQGGV